MKYFLAIVLFVLLVVPQLLAQDDMVKESSSGKLFPKIVTFTYDSVDYKLDITGTAIRKKFVFKVYGMAHYMQDPPHGSKEEVFNAILNEDKAKQITMDFSRGVGSGKIQGAYRDGFEKNATEEELKSIQSSIDQFVGYFDKDVKENETYVLRWLPGGTVITIVQGEEKPAIKDATFAKVLWKIWLGKKSIVKRDKLVQFLVAEK
ncbi:MAG: chalcone isomerase family protein [Calditrichia bacterium]